MVGKTARIRKADRRRFEIIKQHCGCLPCLLIGRLDRHTSIEHVTERGRRVGRGSEQHQHTIGLCLWHHFGEWPRHWERVTELWMLREFGPSLAHGRKRFEEDFGDEVKVLIPVQNHMLELFAADPWPEYTVPAEVARQTRDLWIDLKDATAT